MKNIVTFLTTSSGINAVRVKNKETSPVPADKLNIVFNGLTRLVLIILVGITVITASVAKLAVLGGIFMGWYIFRMIQ